MVDHAMEIFPTVRCQRTLASFFGVYENKKVLLDPLFGLTEFNQ